MANLQSTEITNLSNLTVTGAASVGGVFSKYMPFVVASKSDGGTSYTTTGNMSFNNIISQNITVSAGNNRFTVTEAGGYATMIWTMGLVAHTLTRLYIKKNGVYGPQPRANGSYQYEGLWAYRVWDADVGDYFELELGVGGVYAASQLYNNFLIWRVG